MSLRPSPSKSTKLLDGDKSGLTPALSNLPAIAAANFCCSRIAFDCLSSIPRINVSCAALSPSKLFKPSCMNLSCINTLTIDSSICFNFSFWLTIPSTSFMEDFANLAMLINNFIKIAPNAIAAGPVITFPMPLTNPFANVLPSSSPPPSDPFNSFILSLMNSRASPIAGLRERSPIVCASSWSPVPVWLAIAANVLLSFSFFIAASPAAFADMSVAFT